MPSFRAELQRELRDWVGRPTALTPRAAPVAALGRARCGSSARIWRTPARTRSTTRSARRCWRGGWARSASWPRPAPASTAWRAPRPARASACRARSTWARSTWSARRRTSAACGCSARPWCRSPAAIARCARRSMRRCATGWPIPSGTYYLLGSAVGGHPYPYIVRELQAVIGREARAQMLERTGALPDAVIACVGGGSNAIGLFHAFLGDRQRRDHRHRGRRPRRRHWATMPRRWSTAAPGCCTAAIRCCCRIEDGQIQETHSISAGLDYPGVGPGARAAARRSAACATRPPAMRRRWRRCASAASCEGILPALESAHALAGARRWAAHASGGAGAGRPVRARRQGHADADRSAARAGRSEAPR